MTEIEQRRVFARNLNRQLSLSGKTQKEVAEAIGVLPSTFNTWCTGAAIPRMGKVQLLADYFGIKKSELIDDKEPDTPSWYADPETAAIAQQIFDDPELRLLFDAAKDAKPEDLQLVHNMLKALKRKENPESDDPA